MKVNSVPVITILIIFIQISLTKKITKRRIRTRQVPLAHTLLSCADPNTEELEKRFIQLQSRLKLVEDLINIPGNKKYIPEDLKELLLAVPSSSDTLNYGEKECDKIKSQSSFHNMGLCPWFTSLKFRTDRYPFMKAEAVCSCKDCLNMNSQAVYEYGCKPHEILKPVLYRTNECINGTYNWKQGLEPISIACLCNHDYDIQIERRR